MRLPTLIYGIWIALAISVLVLISRQAQTLHAMQDPGQSHKEISQSEILNLRSSHSGKSCQTRTKICSPGVDQ